MLTFQKHTNCEAAVIFLIKHLGLKISPDAVVEELEKHPDYPSLLAISDVLNWFQIDNAAYRVGPDEITNVPTPFIAHTNIGDAFVTVSRIDKHKVTLSDDKRAQHTITITEFQKRFKGVVLTTGAPLKIDETYTQTLPEKLAPYKTPAAILALALCFILTLTYHSPYFLNLSWQALLLALFKTAGLITSILLLIQSIDKNNPLVQTLCGGGGKTDCNAILTSKAATVFKGLTWSEVGFFYFAGTWLILLFAGNNLAILQTLTVLNIVSLPYTFYSINFQVRIAKQWCLFCVIVQAILWLEFFAFLPYLKQSVRVPTLQELGDLTTLMILPLLIWILIKPYLLQSQQLKPMKRQIRSLKYNRVVFERLLDEEAKYALLNETHSLIIGNRDAEHMITILTNPYCEPCSEAHHTLDKWLTDRKDIKLQVLFSPGDEKDPKTKVAAHFMALNAYQNDVSIRQALKDWYSQGRKIYTEWALNYPVTESSLSKESLEVQREWCKMAGIISSPTILINGRKLPLNYQIQDIKYFI